MKTPEWLITEMIAGEPIHVGRKTLTPLARKVSLKFGAERAQGGGAVGFESIEPFAVEEKIDDVTRQIPIEDVTGKALRAMLIGALALWGLLWVVRLFARGWRHARKGGKDVERTNVENDG